jgi:hypothetical protein
MSKRQLVRRIKAGIFAAGLALNLAERLSQAGQDDCSAVAQYCANLSAAALGLPIETGDIERLEAAIAKLLSRRVIAP